VTAEDSTGATVPSYTGTVQLSSTDGHAVFGGNGLPVSYTFVASDNGAHTFTVMLQTAGSQTITATDQANKSLTATTNPITVNAGPFSKFVVSVPDGNTIAAGNPFLFTAQAADSFGNPVTSYSGPTNITATATPADPQSNVPITGTLNSSGFGFFLGNLKTAGSYTLTTTAGTVSGNERQPHRHPLGPQLLHRRCTPCRHHRQPLRCHGHRLRPLRQHRHRLHRHGQARQHRPGRRYPGGQLHVHDRNPQ
jgi:hypothetical protein